MALTLERPFPVAGRGWRSGGTWVVLPTCDELQNLPSIVARIHDAQPSATILVVDDDSADGTGDLADWLALRDPRVAVHHQARRTGLGRAYLDGFRIALARGAEIVCQMDADGSHDPAFLPTLVAPVAAGAADLVIGSRFCPAARTVDWGTRRRWLSQGCTMFAWAVLPLSPYDVTGGFRAWRAEALRDIDVRRIDAGGYGFEIEMAHRAARAGCRIAEVPITFRDRTLGKSKTARRTVAEAFTTSSSVRLDGAGQPKGHHVPGRRTTAPERLALLAEFSRQNESHRQRMVGDLHSRLGGPLVRALFAVRRLQTRPTSSDADVRAELGMLETLIEDAERELRAIMAAEGPVDVDELGLVAALDDRAMRFSLETGIPMHARMIGNPDSLHAAVRRLVLCTADEGLLNVQKHAAASNVWMSVVAHGGAVVLRIDDDGRGIRSRLSSQRGHGIGLEDIRDRTVALGGAVRVGPGHRGGTALRAWIPGGQS